MTNYLKNNGVNSLISEYSESKILKQYLPIHLLTLINLHTIIVNIIMYINYIHIYYYLGI